MAHADLPDPSGPIVVRTEFREKDLIKQVPGSRWQEAERVWTVPLSWASCKVLRLVFGNALTVGDGLTSWAIESHALLSGLLDVRRSALDPSVVPNPDSKLYGYQQTAAQFLALARGGILGDDPGAGKTLTLIATAEMIGPEAFPVLVVCPKAVRPSWKREWESNVPGRRVQVVSGGAVARRKQIAGEDGEYDVLVIQTDLLPKHSRLAPYGSVRLSEDEKTEKDLNGIQWGTVILDEAHRIKNPKGKWTRAAWALGDKARFRFGMTGTPIADTPDDLWPILRFVAPSAWPSRTRYVDLFCWKSWNGFADEIIGLRPDTSATFHELLDLYFVRRPIDLVRPHLPETIFESRLLEMLPKQAKAYREMEKGLIADVTGGQVVALSPMAKTNRLVQFAAAYASVDDAGDVHLESPSCKVDGLLDVIEDVAEPIVVMAESRQLIDLAQAALDAKGIPCVRYTGTENDYARESAIADFTTGRARVFLGTIGACGTGLDGLQHVSRVLVFLQRSWSFIANKQAIGRLRREGQSKPVLVVDLVSAGTVEEEALRLRLEEKEDRLEEIVRDGLLLSKEAA